MSTFNSREEYQNWKALQHGGTEEKSSQMSSTAVSSTDIIETAHAKSSISRNSTQPKSKTITAGWICFMIGMILVFVSVGTFFIYGPLFLAAFILSIVGITQGRIMGGVLLLLATVAIPTVSVIGVVGYKFSTALYEQKQEKRSVLSKLEFESVEGYIDGNYMYLEGKVRNNGTHDVSYVKVGVEWLDNAETVLDTDWTYAVSGESLRPGAAKSFKIMTPTDHRMKKFRYFVMPD